MPKIRNRVDAHESVPYSLSNVTRHSSPLFPDVPLNPQHRYCTPPPLDSTFTEQARVGFPPNMLTRDPSISDYLSLFEEPPPPPPPGSQENPIEFDNVDQGNRQPHHKERGKEVAEAQAGTTTPRRSPRSASQTSTSRRASSGSNGKPYPTTSPSSSTTSTASSSRGTQRKGRTSAAGRKAPKTPARKKAAGNKFAPSVSSPLSQVAFAASRDRTLSPTPPPEAVHGRWYIPPRKHSTGSISAPSESSSDSDSEPDYGAMYYA